MSDLLLPVENMALTVARAQAERGENPSQGVSVMLVIALDRLIEKLDDTVLYEIRTATDASQHEANDQTVEWLKRVGVLVQVLPEKEGE